MAKAKEQVEDVDNEEESRQTFNLINVVWGHLKQTNTLNGCRLPFPNLTQVAKMVLVLPHSNAGEERVFSLVPLNKTSYQSGLECIVCVSA